MTAESNQNTPIAWVHLTLRERRVIDVDGDVVSLEFKLDLPDDKTWYQCFAQATGPSRQGSLLFTDTNPTFMGPEVLAWKIELNDIPEAATYLAARVKEANDIFSKLLERKEMIRRQLEEAAMRRAQAIEQAQRLLDQSWPTPPPPPPGETSVKSETPPSATASTWSTVQPQGAR